MSRTVTRICDRCKGCCVEQGSVIEVKAGDLTKQVTETLDLCTDCSALFADFLRSGYQAAHAGPVGPIPGALGSLDVVTARCPARA
jgi:hypothetical protein